MKIKAAEKMARKYWKSLYNANGEPGAKKRAERFYKKHGFRYEDCWNLDRTIAAFVLPRLVWLKKTSHSCPSRFCKRDADGKVINATEAQEGWDIHLKFMIKAFKLYLKKERYDWNEGDARVWEIGMKYFAEDFCDLWD